MKISKILYNKILFNKNRFLFVAISSFCIAFNYIFFLLAHFCIKVQIEGLASLAIGIKACAIGISIIFSAINVNIGKGVAIINKEEYKIYTELGYTNKWIQKFFKRELYLISILSLPIGIVFGVSLSPLFINLFCSYFGFQYIEVDFLPAEELIQMLIIYVISWVVVFIRKENAKLSLKKNIRKKEKNAVTACILILLGCACFYFITSLGFLPIFVGLWLICIGIKKVIDILEERLKRKEYKKNYFGNFTSLYLKELFIKDTRKTKKSIITYFLSFTIITFGVVFGKIEENASNYYPFEFMIDAQSSEEVKAVTNIIKKERDVSVFEIDLYDENIGETSVYVIEQSNYNQLLYMSGNEISTENDKITIRNINTHGGKEALPIPLEIRHNNQYVLIEEDSNKNIDLFNKLFTNNVEFHMPLLIVPADMKIRQNKVGHRLYNINGSSKSLRVIASQLDKLKINYYNKEMNVWYNKIIASRFYFFSLYIGIALFIYQISQNCLKYLFQLRDLKEGIQIIVYMGYHKKQIKNVILETVLYNAMDAIIAYGLFHVVVVVFAASMLTNSDINLLNIIFFNFYVISFVEIVVLGISEIALYILAKAEVKNR